MTSPWPQWLIAYSIQIAVVVTCAIVSARLLRLKEPKARYACFEGILVLCLCIPFVQSRRPQAMRIPVVGLRSAVESLQAGTLTGAATTIQGKTSINPQLVAAWILIAGMALRFGWLLLGFRGLHRLKQAAQPLRTVPAPALKLLAAIGRQPRILVSDRIGGAITFGLGSGVILLPSRFEGMGEATQAAILCHELMHIRRRDWLLTAIEELVLVFLWFHPAVWWLIREIQQVREEVVDQEVVRSLSSRDDYVKALLEAAGIDRRDRLAPAASFAWRGQLARRVATLFAAGSASRRRRFASFAGVLAVTLLVLRAALIYLPAYSVVHAQTLEAAPIEIESGGEHLLYRARLEYPRWAREERAQGVVDAEVVTNSLGIVLDARVLDGPEDLRRPVLRSVLDWQFDPKATTAGTHEITIRFTVPEPNGSSVVALPGYPEKISGASDQSGPHIFSGKKFFFDGKKIFFE